MGDEDRRSSGRSPPGPDGLPLIGSSIGFVRGGLEFADGLREYGDVVAFDALGREFVTVSDPDLVRTVLVDRNDEFVKGRFESAVGDRIAPDGLVFTEGDRWRSDRTLLQSAFRPDRIRSFADDVVPTARDAAREWARQGTVDVREASSDLTLRILADTLFDVDLDGHRGQVVREAVEAVDDRTSPLSMTLPKWLPTPGKRRFDRRYDKLDDLVAELIAERAAASDPPADLLTTMLAATRESDDRDEDWLRDQLITFLFAGHETTATALTYALWSLAGAPEVRERIDEELAALDGPPSAAGPGGLPYVDAVVDEILRLYPPVYVLYREPTHDVRLGAYEIPASATVLLDVYGLHRDERYWTAPERFRPERFLADDPDRPEYAYLPFGGGPRGCIGFRFAKLELRLCVATLAGRLSFDRVTDSLTPRAETTLDPGRVELRVSRRDDARRTTRTTSDAPTPTD